MRFRHVLLLGIAILTVAPGDAAPGPNEGVVLNVHGNAAGVETGGDPAQAIGLPFDCEDLSPTAGPDQSGVEWFLVVVVSGRRASFSTVTFGLGGYDESACYISFFGPTRPELQPLEIPSAGWPGPNEGTAVSWAPQCLSGEMVPVYYFGVYVYGSTTIPLGSFYPGQQDGVVSCGVPGEEDPIAEFGSFGCGGVGGENACESVRRGAEDSSTWGRIKNQYR